MFLMSGFTPAFQQGANETCLNQLGGNLVNADSGIQRRNYGDNIANAPEPLAEHKQSAGDGKRSPTSSRRRRSSSLFWWRLQSPVDGFTRTASRLSQARGVNLKLPTRMDSRPEESHASSPTPDMTSVAEKEGKALSLQPYRHVSPPTQLDTPGSSWHRSPTSPSTLAILEYSDSIDLKSPAALLPSRPDSEAYQ